MMSRYCQCYTNKKLFTQLAKLVIDKTNIVDVLKDYQKWVCIRERTLTSENDTQELGKGQLLVERMDHKVLLSHKKTLLPLSDEEKLSFVHLLEKLLSED